MAHPGNALTAALYQRLRQSIPLKIALGGAHIYDQIPQNAVFPYLVLGDDTLTPRDTRDGVGWEATFTLHYWDRALGRKLIKTLMGHGWDTLHGQEEAIAIPGFALLLLRCESERTWHARTRHGHADDDYHGIQRFRALISEL